MTRKLALIVWLGLLALTAVEVWLAYIHTPPLTMLIILLFVSFGKAALIASYFMHLRYEPRAAFRLIIPVTVTFALLLLGFLPDAMRLAERRK